MPCATACSGVFTLTRRPCTWISPASIGSAPKTARATSVRPAPIRPARPRISPRRSTKLTSLIALPRLSPLTSSTMSLPELSCAGLSNSSSWRPTIMPMMVSTLVDAIGAVAM